MIYDLFHQLVYQDDEFFIEADHTHIFPTYYVCSKNTGKIIGSTNASNYMGVCRELMNDYRKLTVLKDGKENICPGMCGGAV